jgi:two-component system sensor histidine kinase/response regulator
MITFAELSITRKLIVLMLLASLTSLLLATLMQAVNQGHVTRNNIESNLMTVADVLASNSAAAVFFEDRRQAKLAVESLEAVPGIIAGNIYSLDAGLLGSYESTDVFSEHELMIREAASEQVEEAIATGKSVIAHNWINSVEVVRPVQLDGEVIGTVHISATLKPILTMLVRFLWIAACIVVIVALVVYRMSSGLQARISGPILGLADVVGRVTKGSDYSLRATKVYNDEVGSLIDGFNAMLAQISERDKQLVERNKKIDEQTKSLSHANENLTAAMEVSREAQEEAEAASLAKSQFLARMSHEIRTPMNGVLGMTELLLRQGLEGKQKHFAETIQNSADALLTLINDILDFSKIEAGKLQLVRMEYDLRDVSEEINELLSGHAQNKNIELLCDIAPDTPTRVYGDAMRLRQVLTNLVGNAIKFTDEGEVVVRARLEDEAGGQGEYRFEIIDTGIGIRAENKNLVFELFSQEDDSTTRRYGGTGLGLAICKQLVELMGGEIGVEAAPSQGTIFWFTLPLALGNQKPPRAALAKLEESMPLRVLIVDDNATNREILEHQLAAWGIDAESVDSAQKGLNRLQEVSGTDDAFDLAILDWHMPEMTGLDLARLIRADAELKNIRLVMLSSASAEDANEVMREADIDAYANKPVRQIGLLECLVQALGSDPGTGMLPKPDLVSQDTMAVRIQGLEILLVEDNPVNREVALSMLETMRCKVAVAANGQQAVDLLPEGNFDLVLMDCEMPIMDGYAATNAIREWEASVEGNPNVPIVALTAHALPEVRQKCFAVGMDDYLTKPFSLEQLRTRIDRWRDPVAARADMSEIAAPLQVPIEQSSVIKKPELEPVSDGPEEKQLMDEDKQNSGQAINADLVPDITEAPSPLVDAEPELIGAEEVTAKPVAEAITPDEAKAAEVVHPVKPREAEVVRYTTLESIIALDPTSGEGLLARLIGMYESNSVELLKDIQASYTAQDAEGVRKGAHALKSSSGNVGAERLAVICKEIEFAARKDALAAVEGHVAMLANEHSMVLEKLHEHHPGEPA